MKNAFVLAGLAFGTRVGPDGAPVQALLVTDALVNVLAAAGVFTVLASGVYVLNDLLDREQDRLHPTKCRRPLAAGDISPAPAVALGVVLVVGGLLAGATIPGRAIWVFGTYLTINVFYTLWWKNVVLLDVFSIASGFVLRVVGGVLAAGAVIRPWIVVCTLFLALLISLGKRRGEIVLLGEDSSRHRPILGEYPLPFLDLLIVSAAAMTVIAYALFTIESGRSHYLMSTIPFVLYGVYRYLYLIYVRKATVAPETLVLSDVPLLIAGAGWLAVAALLFLYT